MNLGQCVVFTSLFLLLGAGHAQAQSRDENPVPLKKHKRFSIGPRVEGNQMSILIDQYVGDKYYINNSSEQYQGYRLGVFGRMDRKRNYLQAELDYYYNTAFVQFVNLKPEEDWGEGVIGVWTHSGPIYTYRRAEAVLAGGHKFNKWLRLQVGAIFSYHFYDNFYRHSPERYARAPMMRNNKIMHDFAFTYHRWGVSGKASLGADLGRFIIDVGYETNLTPLSKQIEYQGRQYPLRQGYYQWQISLGYKLVKL